MKHIDQDKLDVAAYLRGDMSADDVAIFEAYMVQNAEFAADVEFQKTLRETLQAESLPETNPEFGWARLSKAIDEETDSSLPVAANDRAPRVRLWQYAALALACVVFGQAYVIGTHAPDDANDKYFMAGHSAGQSHIMLKASESVTVAGLTEFLSENDAMITSGPNLDGQYEISFQTLEACDIARKALRGAERNFEMTTGCEEK